MVFRVEFRTYTVGVLHQYWGNYGPANLVSTYYYLESVLDKDLLLRSLFTWPGVLRNGCL